MKRPNTALTGIDQKLSAEVTWALNVTERPRLDAVHNGAGAPGILKLMLVFSAVVFAIGVQMPGLTWLWASLAAAGISVLGVLTSRMLRRRGHEARLYLDDLVHRQYGARLLLIRAHDVIVEAGRPTHLGYPF